MTKKQTSNQEGGVVYDSGPGWFVYALGVVGAGVFFVGQASGFWAVVLALLQALVWPAFLVFELFLFLA